MTGCYRFRAWGMHNIPKTGPVLLVSNHQSFLDPILVGVAGHRRQFVRAGAFHTCSTTRSSSWLIRSLNAIPRRTRGVGQHRHATLHPNHGPGTRPAGLPRGHAHRRRPCRPVQERRDPPSQTAPGRRSYPSRSRGRSTSGANGTNSPGQPGGSGSGSASRSPRTGSSAWAAPRATEHLHDTVETMRRSLRDQWTRSDRPLPRHTRVHGRPR